MEIKEVVEKLEKSKEFKEFIKDNSEYYLVHAFTMLSNSHEEWQLGYYSKEQDRIVVFEIGEDIRKAPEQEVFKEKKVVRKLDLEKVKLEPDGAFKVATKMKDEKYHAEKLNKSILILQNIDGEDVYNITLITNSFNILNYKISADTGQVLEENRQSILSLGKKIK